MTYNSFGYVSAPRKAQFDLEDQFRKLESYCDGRRSVVIVFPLLYNFDNYLLEVEHQRIHSVLDGLNYSMLDLLDVYREYDADSLILEPNDRVHPNPKGARIAAEATFDLLGETQLAPIWRESTNPN